MKILQILLPSGLGGVERIASQLLISNQKDECYLGIDKNYYNDFISYFYPENKNIILLDCSSIVSSLYSVKKCITTVKPDIVHTHARREMIFVCLCKNKFIHIRTQHMEEKPRIPVTIFEKILLSKKVDRWIATSKKLAKLYLESKNYIDSKKISIVYNGTHKGRKRNSFEVKRKYCIICRLTKQKGIDILIKEIAEMDEKIKRQISIDIWGEGEELKAIFDLVKKLKVNNIFKYKGKTSCPAEVVVNYDALLMPSRNEGLPLTMLESMSTGTPVAIHDGGCMSEFIISQKNGWIINAAFTWKDFFDEILESQEYENICKDAEKTFDELFSLEIMQKNYFEIYRMEVKN